MSLRLGETWACKLKPKGGEERKGDKFSRKRLRDVKEHGKFRKSKLSSN